MATETSQGTHRWAVLTDTTRLAAFTDALGNWQFTGYIQFELSETAYRWLRCEFEGIGLKDIGRLMYEFVQDGGPIDEVRETRPEWRDDYEFHYDLRFEIRGKPVYIECRLHHQIPLVLDESWILVVNIHDP